MEYFTRVTSLPPSPSGQSLGTAPRGQPPVIFSGTDSGAAVAQLVTHHVQESHLISMYSADTDWARVLDGANPHPNKESEEVEKKAHREPKVCDFLRYVCVCRVEEQRNQSEIDDSYSQIF